MSIGVDVVDLAAVPHMDAIRFRRYSERACSPEELNFIKEQKNPQLAFWKFWAMKEAIYKCTFDSENPEVFKAREVPIPFYLFMECKNSCIYKKNRIMVELNSDIDKITAIAYSGNYDFSAVQNPDQIHHGGYGEPLLLNGEPISIAHHGRFRVAIQQKIPL